MSSKLSAADILERARTGTDAAAVGRVFGTPIERDGVTMVPVAVISGGAGSGSGSADGRRDEEGGGPQEGEGSGGAYGFSARPAGAYVIRDGKVSWSPAIDVNKIVLGGQLVAVAAFLLVRAIVRRHR